MESARKVKINITRERKDTPDDDVLPDERIVYKTKDVFLKNHLLTETMGSNASSFINVKKET